MAEQLPGDMSKLVPAESCHAEHDDFVKTIILTRSISGS
jgi:hypothetical protein